MSICTITLVKQLRSTLKTDKWTESRSALLYTRKSSPHPNYTDLAHSLSGRMDDYLKRGNDGKLYPVLKPTAINHQSNKMYKYLVSNSTLSNDDQSLQL